MRGRGVYKAEDLESQLSSREFLSSYKHPKLSAALAERRLAVLSEKPSLWIYMGRSRDYIIVPRTYCSCKDFLVNTVGRMKPRPCYHLVAQVIAEEKHLYRDLTWIKDKWVIIREILNEGFSKTLRKALKENEGVKHARQL